MVMMKENNKESSRRSQNRQEALLEQIRAYAKENTTQKILLKDVAKHCGVSVSTVTQLFRKSMNDTFHNYLTRLRMEMAAELIREGTALEEVGRQVGYVDHSSFYRAFCQTFDKSPREYKRELGKQGKESK